MSEFYFINYFEKDDKFQNSIFWLRIIIIISLTIFNFSEKNVKKYYKK